MAARVPLRTIFKISIEVANHFRAKKFMVHEVGIPEKTDTWRSVMRGSTVFSLRHQTLILFCEVFQGKYEQECG